ncbi:MAG TPA: cytochrome c3 family protein, partial [Verrucomicrobiae bacterium]|nr:cytochrome c3 family protein [Verrucomicrobiae bacterium]
AALGQCAYCHNPHESDEKGLLRKKSRDVCLGCHGDFATAMAKAAVVHPPVQNDPCTRCHNPHGSKVLHVLNSKMPDVCIGCHVRIGKKIAEAKTQHKPLLENESCGNCHSSHFSPSRGLLASAEKSVCLGCHGKDGLGKPPLRNISKEIDGKKVLHGPIQKGKCSACHDPHGSDYFRMLPAQYPKSFYTKGSEGNYDACLTCHNKDIARYSETETATNFRNGRQNLHYLHVGFKMKGRSCRACHDVHGSNGPKLVSVEGSPFGEWKIPTRFVQTPTGGSCSPGCHRLLKYDRITPQPGLR